MINITKSSVSYSTNVSRNCRQAIQNTLGISSLAAQDKYLGLPTLIGRNKRKTFSIIKDRVWQRVRSWKGNLFSAGGKEVLIKAVVQAIPSYTMSLFKLPVTLCKELEAMCSRFWWGSNGTQRRMCWASWKRLCQPKQIGGLGFRDLSLFNKALLAKQAWKILTSPNALVSQVLRAKYFRNSEFLSCSVRNGASHLWNSILWGRNLLYQGLRRKIGNGLTTRAFLDPWLPRPTTFKTITPGGPSNLTVADLINQDSCTWNREMINHYFYPVDIEAIRLLPLSLRPLDDSWMWHFDKRGIYSVKSGYKLAMERSTPDSSSNPSTTRKWWRILWNLNIPPKVKVFIWRSCSEALPSALNLFNRNVSDSKACFRCGDVESVGHALFWCRYAKEAWSAAGLYTVLKKFLFAAPVDVFRGILQCKGNEFLSQVCTLVWGIWWNRNKSLHGDTPLNATTLVEWSSNFLHEFQSTRSAFQSAYHVTQPQTQNSWIAPPSGYLKLNTDAAVRPSSHHIGIGATIRDSEGLVVAAVSMPLPGSFNVEMAELLALREGLCLANSLNLPIWRSEVDAINVVSRIKSKSVYLDDASTIVKDIIELLLGNGLSMCHHIPRQGNVVAHALASKAVDSNLKSVWHNASVNSILAS